MKIAVINFSGNVGKSTVARHLLLPRVEDAELIAVESLNANVNQGQALRGRQFGELQEYLHTVDNVIVDIGASNVEDLLGLMQRYRGSHEDFDFFVVPTVPALKQQQDTIATLIELADLGVAPARIKLVFNMVDDDADVPQAFRQLLAFIAQRPVANVDLACKLGKNEIYARVKDAGNDLSALTCKLGKNEIYARVKDAGNDLSALARDETDYKALIVRAGGVADKLALAQRLATRRLASGVVPELDACFAALALTPNSA